MIAFLVVVFHSIYFQSSKKQVCQEGPWFFMEIILLIPADPARADLKAQMVFLINQCLGSSIIFLNVIYGLSF